MGKTVGIKRPLTQKQIWVVRFFLDREGRLVARRHLIIDKATCDRIRAVMYARPGWNHGWLFRDDKGGRIEVSVPHRVKLDDLEAVTEAPAPQAGLAWIPSWLARPHIETGTLVEVLEDQPCFSFANYALWPEARHVPLKVRIVLDLLTSELPRRPDPEKP